MCIFDKISINENNWDINYEELCDCIINKKQMSESLIEWHKFESYKNAKNLLNDYQHKKWIELINKISTFN